MSDAVIEKVDNDGVVRLTINRPKPERAEQRSAQRFGSVFSRA